MAGRSNNRSWKSESRMGQDICFYMFINRICVTQSFLWDKVKKDNGTVHFEPFLHCTRHEAIVNSKDIDDGAYIQILVWTCI